MLLFVIVFCLVVLLGVDLGFRTKNAAIGTWSVAVLASFCVLIKIRKN
jgi:hypothetical protein